MLHIQYYTIIIKEEEMKLTGSEMIRAMINFVAIYLLVVTVLSLAMLLATLDGYYNSMEVRHAVEAINMKQNAYVTQAADYARANYLRDWEDYR